MLPNQSRLSEIQTSLDFSIPLYLTLHFKMFHLCKFCIFCLIRPLYLTIDKWFINVNLIITLVIVEEIHDIKEWMIEVVHCDNQREADCYNSWVGRWMRGWMEGKARLRIAYSNKKYQRINIRTSVFSGWPKMKSWKVASLLMKEERYSKSCGHLNLPTLKCKKRRETKKER